MNPKDPKRIHFSFSSYNLHRKFAYFDSRQMYKYLYLYEVQKVRFFFMELARMNELASSDYHFSIFELRRGITEMKF